MDPALQEILKRMGWTTGMHLPVANKENKALQEEVEALMIRKARATQYYETEENRYNAFVKHAKYVDEQSNENQQLITNYHNHLETQEHSFLLKQSEKQGVQQELRQEQKRLEEINERLDIRKADLERGYSKVEKKKLETNWDNEALKSWEEALKKRDEDTELLKKFTKQDEKKARDLEMKRQNLQAEITARGATLSKVIGDVTNYELVIERIGRVFLQQKEERKALLKQWKDAVDTLKRRDLNMKQVTKEIDCINLLISNERDNLEEQSTFLQNQIKNNKELEQQIHELNFICCKMRQDLNDVIQWSLTLSGELSSLKRNLLSSARCLEKERANGKNLTRDIGEREIQLKRVQLELDRLKQKLADVKTSSSSASERANQMESIINDEQKETKILEQDVARIQGVYYRTQQVLAEVKNTTKTKEMEITGTDLTMIALKKKIISLNDELIKQKELNYNLDFEINEMECRLNRIEKTTVDDDVQVLLDKIAELEKQFADENELKGMIQKQIVNIEDEMRRLTAAIESDNTQMETLKNKLQNEVLACEDGIKQTKEAKQRLQHKQVSENVLRLRVNQLENVMKREEISIYSMQKFRLELETAMRERQIEINTNKDILIVKRRNLDEEKCRLKKDIGQRQGKIHQLQQRFHIAQTTLGKDEDGQPLSITHFKLKNAQEKQLLQEEGDMWDQKIKKFEKEIVAMENTLKIVNLSNVTYRQSLSAVEESDQECQDKKELEAEISAINSVIRTKKQELAFKKNHLKELNQTLIACDDDKMEAFQLQGVYEVELGDLKRHESGHVEKLNRADRHLQTCMKNLDMQITEKYHKNILIRQLQEANNSALQQLSETSTRFHETTPHITRYTYEQNLELPGPKLQFLTSSSSCSTRSSEYYVELKPSVATVLYEFSTSPRAGNRSATKKSPKGKIKGKR